MCCGSHDDYYTVTPYRPSDEKPHPSVSRDLSQWYHQPQTRDPRCEEIEKRQRQAKASAAAQRYGWPTDRAPGNVNHPPPRSRDSIIERNLAIGLTTMSGLDYAAVYDPARPRQQRNYSPSPPRPAGRPPYYGEGIINQQPGTMPPMNAPPMRAQPNRDMRWKSQGVPQLTNIHIPPAMAPPIRAPDERIARVESPVIPKYLTKPIPQHTPVIKMHRERDRSTESLVTHQLPSKPMRPMNAPRIRTPPEQIARVDSPVIPQYLAKPMPPIPQHTPATKMTRGRDRSAGSLVTHQRPIRTSPQQRARKESPIVHQRPPIAQEIIVHKQDRPPPEPETARISYLPSRTKSLKKRDSNCVSLLSDDGIEFEFLERRSVSPIRND